MGVCADGVSVHLLLDYPEHHRCADWEHASLLGELITFDTTGIDFALTALFIVILIEQILGADNRLPAWLAFVSAIVCLLIFGPSNFILPSLVITVALLSILRHRIEPVKAVKEEKEEA